MMTQRPHRRWMAQSSHVYLVHSARYVQCSSVNGSSKLTPCVSFGRLSWQYAQAPSDDENGLTRFSYRCRRLKASSSRSPRCSFWMLGPDGHLLIRCCVSQLLFIPSAIVRLTCLSGRALLYKAEISAFVSKEHDLIELDLTALDWQAIELVSTWLYLFREATTQMSATRHNTLQNVRSIFIGLQDEIKSHIRNLPSTAPAVLKDGLLAAYRKLSDYFDILDQSPFYLWACCTSFIVFTDWY